MPAETRVIVLGTPAFAVPVLRALVAAPKITVVLVVTQPDRPAGRGRRLVAPPLKLAATEAGLPCFQPERLRGPAALQQLRAAQPDLFVIAAYGQLLHQPVLDIPPHGCLNVHPSLLPRHRGPAPIAAAILAGDPETGVSIMLTERGLDTGPVLTQQRLPLTENDTTASLTPRLAELGATLLVETIPPWLRGTLTPQPQDETRATTSRLLQRDDGAIDWTQPANTIARQIRALNPWPRAFTFAAHRRLLLLDATVATTTSTHATGRQWQPGMVARDEHGHFLVHTGAGLVLVREAQLEGRRRMAGPALLRAHQELPGLVLGPV